MTWRLLSEPPDLPGLVLRGFAGDEDFTPMAAVLNAACAADGVDRVETAEQMARHYTRLDNCDPATDVIIAEIDGEVVGYGRVLWWQEHAGPYVYLPFCFLRPEARGQGLGTAMLAHNEARLREMASGHPAAAERHFEVFHAESESGAAALYAAFGYEPFVYENDMVRPDLEDIPEAPMPEGLVVRTPREDEMRAVWEAADEAFRDHLGAAPGTENDYLEFLEFPWNDTTLWRVAWDGDEVAGQVRSYINEDENREFGRRRGYVEYISVRRPYRRRGLARSLIVQSLHAVKERGMEEAALGVLTENLHGALNLYRSVGFRPVRTWTNLRKPLD